MRGDDLIMNNKDKIIQIIGVTGTVLGVVSTLLSNWSQNQNIEKLVDEKVNEALSKMINK